MENITKSLINTLQSLENEGYVFVPESFKKLTNIISGFQKKETPVVSKKESIVWGAGSKTAKIMFIGDFLSEEDFQYKIPFSGEEGILLQKIVRAMNLTTQDIYLTTLIKDTTPNHNDKEPVEQKYLKYLSQQIDKIEPRILILLGEFTKKNLIENKNSPDWLNTICNYNNANDNHNNTKKLRVFCTYHPRDLIKNPTLKRSTWEVMKKIMKLL